MKIIEVNNVSYKYNKDTEDEVLAVDRVSIDINQGEFVVILGQNGSGKSTLAKMLNGLVLPNAGGSVKVFDMLTTEDAHIYDIRKNVGIVFQNPDNQMIASIVEDDIAFGPENIGLPREEIIERVEWALTAVDMLQFRYDTPFKMSGGQKQRIAIAGILALRPQVLVLDESTAMLDPKGKKEVMEVITRLNKDDGITVVLITHHMEETINADKVIVLKDAQVVAVTTPKELFSNSSLLEECKLVLPLATEIAHKLNQLGIDIPKNILSEQELEDAICRLM